MAKPYEVAWPWAFLTAARDANLLTGEELLTVVLSLPLPAGG